MASLNRSSSKDPPWRVLRRSALAVLVLVAGCSERIALPTHVDGEGGVGYGGRLGGEAHCLWLENGPNRAVVIWPAGFTALTDPLRVVAPDGRVIATVGDEIEGGADPRDRGPVPGCGIPGSVVLTEINFVNKRRVMFPTPGPRHPTLPPPAQPR